MSLIYAENWDSDCTPPALPTGWNVYPTSNTWATAAESGAYSLPNVLALSSSAVYSPTPAYYYATWAGSGADTYGGNVQLTAYLSFTLGETSSNDDIIGITARGSSSTLDDSSTTYYAIYVNVNPTYPSLHAEVAIAAVSSGTWTSIGSVTLHSPGNTIGTGWYSLNATLNGSNISITLVRLSDGYSLNTAGIWQSIGTDCLFVTDSTISGNGYYGFFGLQSAANQGLWVDNWTLYGSAAPLVPPHLISVGWQPRFDDEYSWFALPSVTSSAVA